MVLLLLCIHILTWYPVSSSTNCMENLIIKHYSSGLPSIHFFLLLSGYYNTLQRIKEIFIWRINECQWFAFVAIQNSGILLKKNVCPQESY